ITTRGRGPRRSWWMVRRTASSASGRSCPTSGVASRSEIGQDAPPMRSLEGSIVALATPFRGGAVDEEAYARLIHHQLANGTSGLVPMGTTGEAATLSIDEQLRGVRLAVQLAKGKVPVVA